MSINGSNADHFIDYPTTQSITELTWHHYAIVSDSINRKYSLYVDGSLVLSTDVTDSTYDISNNIQNYLGSQYAS